MYLIVDSPRLTADTGAEADKKLECYDDLMKHSWRDGHGGWIRPYMERMECYANHLSPNGFVRSSIFYKSVSQTTFNNIVDPRARNLLIEFTNRYYLLWLKEAVKITPYEEARLDNRSFCFDCVEGWSCPFRRNLKLGERVFTCQEDCAEFEDRVGQSIAISLSIDTSILDAWWYPFLKSVSESALPDLNPVWLDPKRTMQDVEAVLLVAGDIRIPVSDTLPALEPILLP